MVRGSVIGFVFVVGLLSSAAVYGQADFMTSHPRGDTLHLGMRLYAGESLVSASHKYLLEMRGDGNLVLYYIPSGKAVWSTKTAGTTTNPALVMQLDGNLVLYNTPPGLHVTADQLWATNTAKQGHGDFLVVQDDGNMVEYGWVGSPSNYKPIWVSPTWHLTGETGAVPQS